MFHRTVVGRGKHETHADTIDAVTDLFSAQCQVNSGRFENIGAAAFAGGPAVTVLGHLRARSRCHQCRGGGHIEFVRTAASGSAGIHQMALICNGNPGGKFTHH